MCVVFGGILLWLRNLTTRSLHSILFFSPTAAVIVNRNNIHDKVVRLPCAHIFHAHCITDWLGRHCTCPTCRYELPTDDPRYEAGRKQRMLQRKPRYAQYELDRMSISELKRLLPARYRISNGHFSDKRDLVEYLIAQGFVDLIRAPPPIEFPNRAFLQAMGVGELKRTMNEAGVYFDPKDVVEKEDMVQIFCNSGRICLTEAEPEDHASNMDGTDRGYGHAAFDRPQQFPLTGIDNEGENASDAGDGVDDDDNSGNDQHSNSQGADSGDDHEQGTKVSVAVETVEESDSDDLNTSNDADDKNDNHIHDVSDKRQGAGLGNVEAARKQATTVVVETVDENDELVSPSQSFQDATNDRSTAGESWNCNVVMEEAAAYDNNSINNNQAAADERDYAFVDRDENSGSASSEWEAVATTPAKNDNNANDDDPKETEYFGSSFISSGHIPEPAAAAASVDVETHAENDSDGMDTSSGSERKRPRRFDKNNGVGDSDIEGDRTGRFQSLSISDMRNLAREQGIDISSCIERNDIENRLASAARKQSVASSHAQMQDEEVSDDDNTNSGGLTVDTFQNWSVSHLRACGHSMDVDLSNCTTHEDMTAAMLTAATERPHVASYLASLTPLMSMKISELRALARERGVNVSDCLEKGEMIARLATAFESASI